MNFNFIRVFTLLLGTTVLGACSSPKQEQKLADKGNHTDSLVEQKAVAIPENNDSSPSKQTGLSQIGASEKTIIPSGWEVKSQSTGDLNKDGIADLAFITIPDSVGKIYVREEDGYKINCNTPILAVYWGKSDGTFEKYQEWHNVFAPQTEVETYDELSLEITENGTLRIKTRFFYALGSGDSDLRTYIFRFQDGNFYCIGMNDESIDRMSGEEIKTSSNYLTGKRSVTIGNAFDETVKPKTTWETFKVDLQVLGAQEL